MPVLPASVPRAIRDAVAQAVAPRQTVNTNDFSDFDSQYQDTKSKVETGRTVVQGGIIAIIVVIVVVVIATCVGCCCVYNRTQTRRRERQAMQNKENNHITSSYGQTQVSQFQPTTTSPPVNTYGGAGPTEPPPVYGHLDKPVPSYPSADAGHSSDHGAHSGSGGHSGGHSGGASGGGI